MIKLTFNSTAKSQMIDITNEIKEAVITSGIKEGVVHVFVAHATASIFIAENADLNLKRDILTILTEHIPANGAYHHTGGNAEAHIKSSMMGSSVMVPVQNASLEIGKWQGIFLADFDGPRERTVVVTTLSNG
jgi:secondary thiamine-phosphate synthase enzyme